MFKRILLIPSVDGNEQLAQRAVWLGSAETQVEIFDPVYDAHLQGYLGHAEVYESLRERLVRERQERTEELAHSLTALGLRSVAKSQWDYPRYDAVVRYAIAVDADLIISGPLGGMSAALSHQDWRMISMCPLPVLVVRRGVRERYTSIAAAVDPFHAHDKPAELDNAILEYAMAIGTLTLADLKVVHSFLPLFFYANTTPGAEYLPLDEAEEKLEAYKREGLQRLVTAAGLEAGVASLVEGRPETVLKTMAEQGEIDLIVMGGLSRGRIRDFLIGSTAERVLSHVDIDTLIVKPPGFGE